MDLTRRFTATAVAIVAVAAAGGLGGAPAVASPKPETPDQVEARTGHHDHDVCGAKKPGQASCLAKVIDRGASDPRPLAATAPYGASPSAIKAAYGFPTSTTAGAGQTIAVIDAYDNPTVQSDLAVFSNTYGLPCNGCLTKVNQTGGTSYPASNDQWSTEINLDVQWAHAIAPGANILLVEATTNSWSDLMVAIDYAKARASYVTMSFGGPEFLGQTSYDSHFSAPGVSFFASSGDYGLPAYYPSASPNVVSVGGTTLNGLGTSTISEVAWSSGGGGCSAYETATAAQKAFSQYAQVGCVQAGTTTGTGKRATTTPSVSRRATPDVSLDANPMTGVSVYSSTPAASAGWVKVGGTSASAPMFAARAAVAGGVMDSSRIYGAGAPPMRDITSGNNGAPALTGYDMATGRGSWFDGVAGPPPPPPPPPAGITNGGFETGNLSGWTPSGTASAVTGSQASGTWSAQVGSPSATNGDSSVAQAFTAAGTATTLSFWYKPSCPTPASDWVTATLLDGTTGTASTVLPPTCSTPGAYQHVVTAVTAGHSYTLTVTNHDDNVPGLAAFTQLDAVTSY